MQKRRLGSTDLWVSPIGLGTVKFGRNEGVKYPQPFSLPTDKALSTLLGNAKDWNVNLLDTAPAYGSSEERLGRLLHGQRHDWVISTKVGESFHEGESTFDFSKPALVASVERSLTRLKTDYLDVVLVHSNGDDDAIIETHHVFDVLSGLKTAGKIRAFGMSTKTVSGGLATLLQADVAMVSYNPSHQSEREVIEKAHDMQKGIFIKKAFESGHMMHEPAYYLQFALSQPGVSSVIVGTINPQHLQENIMSVLG